MFCLGINFCWPTSLDFTSVSWAIDSEPIGAQGIIEKEKKTTKAQLHHSHAFAKCTDLLFIITMNIKKWVLKFEFLLIYAGNPCLWCLKFNKNQNAFNVLLIMRTVMREVQQWYKWWSMAFHVYVSVWIKWVLLTSVVLKILSGSSSMWTCTCKHKANSDRQVVIAK